MALTYGMIGDRLSDLVAELHELNDDPDKRYYCPANDELELVVTQLDAIRVECDAMSGKVWRVFN